MLTVFSARLREAVLEKRPFSERFVLAALSAAVFAFTLTVFAPLDIFAGNRNEFAFPLGTVLPSLLLCFAVLFVGLVGLLLLCRGKVFNIAVSLVCMLGVCLYAQGSFFNGNLGILDGTQPNWQLFAKRAYLDTLLWALLLVLPSVLRYFSMKWWRGGLLLLSAAVLAMEAAALVSLGGRMTSDEGSSTFLMSKEGQFSLSDDTNVVLFVIDTFDNAYLDAVLAEEPGYLDDFDGFTYYRNNAGVHSRTFPSVPQMLSGKVFHFDEPFYETYLPDVWEGESLPRDLSRAGYDVRFYAWDALFASPALSCVDNLFEADASNRETLYRLDPVPFTKMLLQFAVYRCWPHVLKPVVWMDGDAVLRSAKEDGQIPVDNAAYYVIDDFQFYDNLGEAGVTADCEKPAFRYYHLRGTHNPYDMTADVQRVTDGSVTDIREVAKGELSIVRRYLEEMREAGVYDNTLVIVTADHGEVHSDYASVGDPILLVKPVGAAEPFAVSEAPASLADIAATALDAASVAGSLPGTPLYKLTPGMERERAFYLSVSDANNCDLEMIEYRITGDVNDKANWAPTGRRWPATYPCY